MDGSIPALSPCGLHRLYYCQHAALSLAKLPVKATTPDAVPLIILLVSRSHVQLLNDDSGFCSRLISRSFQYRKGQRIDLLAAVVDGVTYPHNVQAHENSEISEILKREGIEGISVWISDAEQAASDLWSGR